MAQTPVPVLLEKPGVVSAMDENYSLYVVTDDKIKWLMSYRNMDGSPMECGLSGTLIDISLQEAAETMKTTIDAMKPEIAAANLDDPADPVSGINIVVNKRNPDGTFVLACLMVYGDEDVFDE